MWLFDYIIRIVVVQIYQKSVNLLDKTFTKSLWKIIHNIGGNSGNVHTDKDTHVTWVSDVENILCCFSLFYKVILAVWHSVTTYLNWLWLSVERPLWVFLWTNVSELTVVDCRAPSVSVCLNYLLTCRPSSANYSMPLMSSVAAVLMTLYHASVHWPLMSPATLPKLCSFTAL